MRARGQGHQDSECEQETIAVPRVNLRLRAGISGFETEEESTPGALLGIPADAVRALELDSASLLALRVRDRGMEPMLFEDDWVVIDTNDTILRSREAYAVNWNGEACIQQLVRRGAEWYLNYLHEDFKPINVRSGRLHIVGRAVYQPGRLLTGRL